jgi:hypothetical protein
MTRAEKLKALQNMDCLIEHAGSLCASYELAQMEIMATVAKARSTYRSLLPRKLNWKKLFDQPYGDESAARDRKVGIGLGLHTA